MTKKPEWASRPLGAPWSVHGKVLCHGPTMEHQEDGYPTQAFQSFSPLLSLHMYALHFICFHTISSVKCEILYFASSQAQRL